jgi:hypothetical protein
VNEARKREFGGAQATADRVTALAEEYGAASPGKSDGRGQTVRSGTDNHCIVGLHGCGPEMSELGRVPRSCSVVTKGIGLRDAPAWLVKYRWRKATRATVPGESSPAAAREAVGPGMAGFRPRVPQPKLATALTDGGPEFKGAFDAPRSVGARRAGCRINRLAVSLLPLVRQCRLSISST